MALDGESHELLQQVTSSAKAQARQVFGSGSCWPRPT
ncbi:hypothetical protein GZL_00568 [Streptomyces sp. 769]|nr:hypothetical protein GZL_00568 [Streptomyces sp. 769]